MSLPFLFIIIPPSHSSETNFAPASSICYSSISASLHIHLSERMCIFPPPTNCLSFILSACNLLLYPNPPISTTSLHLNSSPPGTGSDDFFAAGGSGGRSSAAAYVTASLSHASATLSLQGTPIASHVSDVLHYIASNIISIFFLMDCPPSLAVTTPYYPSFHASFLPSLIIYHRTAPYS